jgi:hypothetical protein
VKAILLKCPIAYLIIAATVLLVEANAQSSKICASKKDTVSVFGSRLKITLTEGAFKKISEKSSLRKYDGLFNLHDAINSCAFVLRGKDTLVFYMTSISRPLENDGGISTWQVINSFLDKSSAYRMESGWKKMGHDYLYFVKLILDSRPDQLFEFNFFFIDDKLVFSLLQRSIKELGIIEQESFTLIKAR